MKTPRTASLVTLALLAAAAFFFRQPLRAWFFPEQPASVAAAAPDAGVAPFRFSPAALETLQLTYGTYELLRADLAADSLARAGELGGVLARTTGEVSHREKAMPPRVVAALGKAFAAAEGLQKETDVAKGRRLFGALSEGLVAVAMEDARVAGGWHLFECPMAEGYKRWLQPEAQMANPYMGTRMLKCGSLLDLEGEAATRATAATGEVHGASEIAWYTCPMHPGVRQSGPGPCPLCGMDLVAVTHGDLATGVVTVDEVRRQKIGVKVEPVKKGPFVVTVRTVGEVKYDETRLLDVTLKVGGFIRGLEVSATGAPVKKGQTLFHLYSPDLFSAQQEYLLALKARGGDQGDPMVKAARQKLRLWDISDDQLQDLAARGEPLEKLPVRAPASGYVIEKEVVEGAAVQPGMKLYRIAALDKVWVEAQVYESELPHVKAGLAVDVELPFIPGQKLTGKVAYVYPYLNEHSRTGQVRIELANPGGVLKPKMYADVTFRIDRGERLQVPLGAVIYTGPRRLVFVDLGEGRLRPREVQLGLRGTDVFEIVSGLTEGERVVTSGNFLIAAESRLRSAAEYWGGEGSAPVPKPPEGAGHVH
jgi:membrane fusion protein, copper/silver efflux system